MIEQNEALARGHEGGFRGRPRRPRPFGPLLIMAAVALTFTAALTFASQPTVAASSGLAITRVVGINLAGGWGSQRPAVSQIAVEIPDAAHQLHVTWIRHFFDWWHVNSNQQCTQASCYNWSTVDPIMQAAATAHVGVVASLGSPYWPSSTPVYPSLSFWQSYVTKFVQRYDHTNQLVIEPWNEPEQNTQGLTAAQWTTQIQIPAYDAVKNADPQVLVHMATVDFSSGGQAWWNSVAAAANGRPFVDLPGFHDYANLAGSWTSPFRSFLNSHHVKYMAIWCSEFGASMTYPVSEPDQAHISVLNSHIPATLRGNTSYPDAAFYYAYSDLAEGGVVHASYGLTDINGNHYDSYGVFQRLMSGAPAPTGSSQTPSASAHGTPAVRASGGSSPASAGGTPSGSSSASATAGASGSRSARTSTSSAGASGVPPSSSQAVALPGAATAGGPPRAGGSFPLLAAVLGGALLVIAAMIVATWVFPSLRRVIPGRPAP